MAKEIRVAGHELPSALAAQVECGAWPFDVSAATLRETFGEDPDPSAKLYTLDEMVGETSRWQHESDPAYLGMGSETLEPTQSILIGDLGIDRPFGIDLRSPPFPIRLLTIEGGWRVVASSVEHLIELLGRRNVK